MCGPDVNRIRAAVVVFALCVGVTPEASGTVADQVYARRIFDDERMVSVNELFANDPDVAEGLTVDEYAKRHPHLTYAALKCKYADGAADALRAFYGALSRVLPKLGVGPSTNGNGNADGLATVVAELDGTKPLFEKMAYNLFHYSDQTPQLRTGDPGLSKTVLSIIAFLQYGREKKPFAVRTAKAAGTSKRTGPVTDSGGTVRAGHALNNSVAQMIGLVERFRYKNCLVDDPDANRDEIGDALRDDRRLSEADAIKMVIKSKIDFLDFLVGEGPVNSEGSFYVPNMYDPKYFLMGSLFERYSALLVNANVLLVDSYNGPLENVYKTVLTTYSIESIMKYQNILLELIGHIFARQIHNNLGVSGNEQVLEDLKTAIEKFINDILPNNCDLNVCGFIFSVNDDVNESLEFILFKRNRRVLQTEENIYDTKKALRSIFDGKIWISKDQINIVNNVQLSYLVDEILQNEGFKVFRQIVRLLSYESNTNYNYHVLKVYDMPTNFELPVRNNVLDTMSQLQSTLFSFRRVCLSNTNNIVLKPLLYTSRYVIKLFEKFDDNRDLRNIILPFLIHLRYVHKHFVFLSEFDFVRLEHMLWFTITVIENYLFQQFKWLTISSRLVYNVLDPEKSKNLFLEKDTSQDTYKANAGELIEYLDNLYSRLYFLDDLPSMDEEKLQFYWNGTYKFVVEIFLVAPRAIIDIQDLINHRLLFIKWFWAKVLLKLKYAVMSLELQYHIHSFAWNSVLEVDLQELMLTDIPFNSKKFFGVTIDLFIYVLDVGLSLTSYSSYVNYIKLDIERKLSSLGVTTDMGPSYSISNIVAHLHHDLRKFKEILSTIHNETELIFISKTISLSIIFLPF